MQHLSLVILLGSATSCFSWLHPTKWNGLRSTFGLNPFSSWNFDSLPRTVADATGDGFRLTDSQCTSSSQTFRGMRYQYREDPHILLLFDKNGFIAGIQMRVLSSKMTPSSENKDRAFAQDGDYWTLTTYFVDPGSICDRGRTAKEFEEQGTGTDLYIQNGTSPSSVFHVPRQESEIKNTLWGNGKCFPWMGKHYWFNVRPDMTEGEFFPYCLLYNGGKLDAFCFAANTYSTGSDRFEHPTGSKADKCCIRAPKFFLDAAHKNEKQSTMHVYLTDSPRTSFC